MSDEFPFSENPADAWGGGAASQNEEEQASQEQMAKAISLVEQGQGIEQVISGLFANLPEHVKQKIRQRLQQAAQEKDRREHEMARQTREKAEAKKLGFGKLFSLGMLSGVISKETIEKIQLLFAQNPHLQQEVSRQGHQMIDKGVTPELDKTSAVPSGPSAGVAVDKSKEQEQQR